MSETLLASVLRALDVTVFERLADGKFRTLGTAPDWLEAALGVTPRDAPNEGAGALPFLDHFLPQAEAAWHERRGARAGSGSFTVEVAGEEALMRATALTVERRSLLLIERLVGDNDTRPLLQKAREQMLAAEQLARQAAAVHAPALAIGRVAAELAAADLGPGHKALVDALNAASAQLQTAADALPKPPSRGRRSSSSRAPR